MSNQTSKPSTDLDASQTQQHAFNEVDKSFTMSTFITAQVGHKITRTTIDSVTEDWSYYDSSTLLYTLRVIYTDSSHSNIVSVERTA